jgi:Protein of unknown function (DUF1566)
MKNQLLLLFFIISLSANAQVGIATSSPVSMLDVNGSLGAKVNTITSSTTLTINHSIVLCNSSSALTITLPSASTCTGRQYLIKNINTGQVTITPNGSQTIDGLSFYAFYQQYNTLSIISNGTNWSILHTNVPFVVGQSYGGGIIFYVDGTGQHGLISSTSDQSTTNIWSNGSLIVTGATGTAVGTGQSNTTTIVTQQGPGTYAASTCNNLVLNGYSDWFLPSKDELNLMYINLASQGLGSFSVSGNWYWSSSEFSWNGAWVQRFSNGFQQDVWKTETGPPAVHVRAIRAF